MADDPKPYELEEGTEEYLCLVAEIEGRWYNQPGTDKTWVERTIHAFDEDFRHAVLVR